MEAAGGQSIFWNLISKTINPLDGSLRGKDNDENSTRPLYQSRDDQHTLLG
jgi:hypothetical protein